MTEPEGAQEQAATSCGGEASADSPTTAEAKTECSDAEAKTECCGETEAKGTECADSGPQGEAGEPGEPSA